MVTADLFDSADAYIVVKGYIVVIAPDNEKK